MIDALKRGYQLGFVGGGDIHDGRPGDQLHTESYSPLPDRFWPSGYTAILVDSLSRNTVFNAIKSRKTYATTASRIYLDVNFRGVKEDHRIELQAASEECISEVAIVLNGIDVQKLQPDQDRRILTRKDLKVPMAPGDFCYVRVITDKKNMAWSSPHWA